MKLEGLLQRAKETAAAKEEASRSGGGGLAALLKRAQNTVKEKEALVAKKKQLNAGVLSVEEAVQTRKAILEWEAKHEWVTHAKTAIFTRAKCTCGRSHSIFSHWMLNQQHREVPTRTRYCMATERLLEDPIVEAFTGGTTVGFQDRTCEICLDCAGEKGVNIQAVALVVDTEA